MSVGAWFAAIVAFWKGHYFVPGAAFALGLGIVLLVPLVAIALSRMEEIAAIAFGRPPRRLANAPPLVPAASMRRRSRSMCRPAASRRTCSTPRSMPWRGIDYPNLECVVVINNTPDPALWRPVEDHCRALGERFKFVRVDNLTGYKAGALRLALAIPRRTPRSSPASMPTMCSIRLAEGSGCRCSPIRVSASCSRRRIIATATAR